MIDETLFGNARTERPNRHARRILNSESNRVLQEKIKSAEWRNNVVLHNPNPKTR